MPAPPPEMLVTDHAIIRYLERVMGVDIERLRRLVLPAVTERSAKTLGDGVYPTPARKHRVVIKKGVVKTVLSPQRKKA